MPVVDKSVLETIDLVLQVAGGLGALAVLVLLLRSPRRVNPLEGVRQCGGPHLVVSFAVLLIYFALAQMIAYMTVPLTDRALLTKPGSAPWHQFQSADAIAKIAVSMLMVVLLDRLRSFPEPGETPQTSWWGRLGIGLLTVLAVVPVCSLQLMMGRALWDWLNPQHAVPVHVVLQALEHTVWGAWGVAQLFAVAVFVAPVAEELFFRGLLLQALWRHLGHAWLAVALSAGLFGYVHANQPQDVLPMVTFGVVLGYLRLRYRSLPLCVLAHMIFNFRTMVFVLLNPELIRG